MCRTDERGQVVVQVSDTERVAQRMAHVIVADAMLAGARRNVWRTPPSYLAARIATSYLAAQASDITDLRYAVFTDRARLDTAIAHRPMLSQAARFWASRGARRGTNIPRKGP